MGSVPSADDKRSNADGQQVVDDENVTQPSWTIEKVVARDGRIIGGRKIVQGQFDAARSCQNDVATFFVICARSYSAPSWQNAQFIVRAETLSAKSKKVPLTSVLHIQKATYWRASKNKTQEGH